MDIRPRFFIKTKDDLFFAVNSYQNPSTHIISFLRYIPSPDGERVLNGVKYKKLSSSEAYDYVKKYHPEYLFDYNVKNKKMMGVLCDDIKEIISPVERLNKIIDTSDDNILFNKIRSLSCIFHEHAGISYENMGVTGSTLLNLQNSTTSDIDFIVYGLDNHKKARILFEKCKNNPDCPLNSISGDYWKQVYRKRILDDTMSFDEFVWYESRKNNRGIIDGTLFDILFTRNPSEIVSDNMEYEQLGKMKITCTVVDDKFSYDSPALYKISNQVTLVGPNVNIENVISFTHTYAGIVKNNERIIVSGVCEKVTDKQTNEKKYNLIVGTTRESFGEYIKLEKNPLKKLVEVL